MQRGRRRTELRLWLTAEASSRTGAPCGSTPVSVPSATFCCMTNTDEGCRIGKSKEFRRLVLGGLGLKEIVHYANGKGPEGELVLEDGRRIGVARRAR
jgi:hypothetical protein